MKLTLNSIYVNVKNAVSFYLHSPKTSWRSA